MIGVPVIPVVWGLRKSLRSDRADFGFLRFIWLASVGQDVVVNEASAATYEAPDAVLLSQGAAIIGLERVELVGVAMVSADSHNGDGLLPPMVPTHSVGGVEQQHLT